MTESLTRATEVGPSHDELMARAAQWRSTLIERSARAEELRRIPPENVEELKQKQFHLAGQPIPFGGLSASSTPRPRLLARSAAAARRPHG